MRQPTSMLETGSLWGVLGAGFALVVLAGCGGVEAPPVAPAADGGQEVAAAAAADPAYRGEIEEWRAKRLAGLIREDGWLSLVGLWWLEPGANAAGSAAGSRVALPPPAPAVAGSFAVTEGRVSFAPAPGVEGVAAVGEAADGGDPTLAPLAPGAGVELVSDVAKGGPTVLALGSLRFFVIDRDGRLGVRVKDLESPARREFAGLEYFTIDPSWRLEARFEPYDPPKKIPVPNVLGTVSDEDSPGAVVFTRDGATYRLDAIAESGESDLFLVFGDKTNGHETYGGGRFLYTDPPGPDGGVVVDFNRAYNPPCAFTEFATCPLPPPDNKLPIRVEAGEKKYAHSAH